MNVPFHRFRCRIGHYTCQIWSCPSYQSRTVHPGGNEIVCAIWPRPTLTHFLRNGACAGEPVTKVPPFRKNPAIFWSVFVLFNEIIRFCPYFSNERNYPCSNAQNYPFLSIFLFKCTKLPVLIDFFVQMTQIIRFAPFLDIQMNFFRKTAFLWNMRHVHHFSKKHRYYSVNWNL